ncbi:MAG: zinc-binding dehydrogenase, partial [Anaerolineae bacterium]|nr:zinc-binding dehydrogenase [Anaerolineae bacterium]
AKENLVEVVMKLTKNWGTDIVFECSGNEKAAATVFDLVCPAGRVVYVGMPGQPIAYDVVAAQVKEVRVEHVFRYAHVYPRALALMGSGKLDVKPLITDTFTFQDSIQAFDYALHMPPTSVKVQITVAKD